jgi:hypothetical protein
MVGAAVAAARLRYHALVCNKKPAVISSSGSSNFCTKPPPAVLSAGFNNTHMSRVQGTSGMRGFIAAMIQVQTADAHVQLLAAAQQQLLILLHVYQMCRSVYSVKNPYRLTRDVVIKSAFETAGQLDFQFLSGKVLVGPGVTVTLENLVVRNIRWAAATAAVATAAVAAAVPTWLRAYAGTGSCLLCASAVPCLLQANSCSEGVSRCRSSSSSSSIRATTACEALWLWPKLKAWMSFQPLLVWRLA